MKNNLILTIVLVIIVGAAGFFGGMKYQQSKQPSFQRQFANQGRSRLAQGQPQANRPGFRPVNGEIIASDDKSITVKLQDGSSKLILIADKTTINKAGEAGREDLKVGEKVAVFGTENSDGSLTAQSIQLNPIFRGQF